MRVSISRLAILTLLAAVGCSDGPAAPGESASGGSAGSGGASLGPGGNASTAGAAGSDEGIADGGGQGGSGVSDAGVSSGLRSLHTQGKDIVDDQGKVVLLRGFGLGGWLVPESFMIQFPQSAAGYDGTPSNKAPPNGIKDAIKAKVGAANAATFWAEYTKNYVTKDDLLAIKSWGFNSLRIPFNANELMPPGAQPAAAPYAYDEAAFGPLDDVASWAAEIGLYLILDMHCAPGGQSADNPADPYGGPGQLAAHLWDQSDVYAPRTVDLWRKLALRYQNNPFVIGYDLINEPMVPGVVGPGNNTSTIPWVQQDDKPLRDLYVQITSVLRAAGDRKIIFAEAAYWALNFKDLTPPWDDNLVYSFHYYPPPTDVSFFNNPADSGPSFSPVFALDVPMWLGETGGRSYSGSDAGADYPVPTAISYLRTANKGHAIGWGWWTDKQLRNRGQPWQCPVPPEYAALIADWAGTPSDAAFDGLMKMAGALQTSGCTLQRALVVAMGGVVP
jgi:endoglucanase